MTGPEKKKKRGRAAKRKDARREGGTKNAKGVLLAEHEIMED